MQDVGVGEHAMCARCTSVFNARRLDRILSFVDRGDASTVGAILRDMIQPPILLT